MFARLARLFDTLGEFSDFSWMSLSWGRAESLCPRPAVWNRARFSSPPQILLPYVRNDALRSHVQGADRDESRLGDRESQGVVWLSMIVHSSMSSL